MALISVQNLVWGFGDPQLIDSVSFQIEQGDKICLLGRNGVGKSSLIKLIKGEILPDKGEIIKQKMLSVAVLDQSVPQDLKGSVFEIVAQGFGEKGILLSEYLKMTQDEKGTADQKRLSELQAYLDQENGWNLTQHIEHIISQTRLNAKEAFENLSAGMKRRVLFARALVNSPDILLLDEPTNHLDIPSIAFLESFIDRWVKTLLFVSHDRSFVSRIAGKVFELDRGKLFTYDCNYESYQKKRLLDLETEEKHDRNFDKKLKSEEKWIRQGIKARRTRNEGRVRALEKMRKEYRDRRKKMGSAAFSIQNTLKTGKLVIEAEGISCSYGGRCIIAPFSTTIMRGDRVGIIGPNGSGKTTLLKLLLDEKRSEKGSVRHGTHFQMAYFDQLREALDEEKTVAENIGQGNDFIVFNGEKRHVVSYLKDFLFTPERARTPVHVLSGGEKNRLMLAKLFTRPFNVLVLDEPTNDLDVETLELLEEILFQFSGTLLLVSHDRAFLNNVVTTTIAIEDKGCVVQYAGGYDDYLHQREKRKSTEPPSAKTPKVSKRSVSQPKKRKLGYMEKRELEALPQKIEALEEEQQSLFATLSDPLFYKEDQDKIASLKTRLEAVDNELKLSYNRWETLESIGE